MITEYTVKNAKNGDEESFNIILKEFSPLIKMVSKKYFIRNGDKDDLFQEGVIGLLKAVSAFDIYHHCSFKTFAMLCIRRQIYSTITSSSTHKQQLLNQAMSDIYVTEEADFEYTNNNKSLNYYNPEDIYISKEKFQLLENYLNIILSSMEIDVFHQLKRGYSYKEIANFLSITNKAADNCIQRIKKKIKIFLDEYNH